MVTLSFVWGGTNSKSKKACSSLFLLVPCLLYWKLSVVQKTDWHSVFIIILMSKMMLMNNYLLSCYHDGGCRYRKWVKVLPSTACITFISTSPNSSTYLIGVWVGLAHAWDINRASAFRHPASQSVTEHFVSRLDPMKMQMICNTSVGGIRLILLLKLFSTF